MSELTLVHSWSRWSSCLGLLTTVLVIHCFVASCKSQPCRFSSTKTLPMRPRVYLVFISTISYPNMSSFGCKNCYYTWTTHSPPSKDWVEKRSKKIKIVTKSQKTVKTNVNQIPGTSWLSERVTRTHPRLANPHDNLFALQLKKIWFYSFHLSIHKRL